MRFERLIIEEGDDAFALPLHPRLTVVAGVGPLEREGLIAELLGALGPGRTGVHLELRSDAGTRYAVRRPAGGPPSVVDLDHHRDVTAHFRSSTGAVDLLARSGVDPQAARSAMRVTEADVAGGATVGAWIERLAAVEPGRLWDAARKVVERSRLLEDAAGEAGATTEEAELIEELERHHREFEEVQAQHERVRHVSFLLAGAAAILIVPAAALLGTWAIIPLLGIAATTAAMSFVSWRQHESARAREDEALARLGARSYLALQVQRANSLLTGDHRRKAALRAAEYHRAALVEWQLLVGEIPVHWAMAHREEVRRAAERSQLPMGVPAAPAPQRASATDALADRLGELRSLGRTETFPALLDEPFPALPEAGKTRMLGLLLDAAADQQIIYLTCDPDVTGWARAEALTGEVGLVEPDGTEEAAVGVPERHRDERVGS